MASFLANAVLIWSARMHAVVVLLVTASLSELELITCSMFNKFVWGLLSSIKDGLMCVIFRFLVDGDAYALLSVVFMLL